MEYRPHVNTNIGPGRLFRIVGDMAHVEFDFMYLVALPLRDVDLARIDLTDVEIINGGYSNERKLERRKGD